MGTFQGGVAVDPSSGGLVAGATLNAYAEITLSTPVTMTFPDTSTGTSFITSAIGAYLPFTTSSENTVWLQDSVSGYVTVLWSYEGLAATASAAQIAAEAAQSAAEGVSNPLPSGGADTYVLAKASTGDYDVEWVAASGGGGSGHTIKDEGTPLSQRSGLDFVGAAVAVSDSSGTDTTVVTIDAQPASYFGNSATRNVGTTAGTVAAGDDSRITGALSSVGYANLPAGCSVTVFKSGGTWPARPTSRADIVVRWRGALPAPTIVTSGTSGMHEDVDVHEVIA